MYTITTTHHNSGATATYEATSYIELVKMMLGLHKEIWLDKDATTRLKFLANPSFKDDGGYYVAPFMEGTMLMLLACHSGGFKLRMVEEATDKDIYSAILTRYKS